MKRIPVRLTAILILTAVLAGCVMNRVSTDPQTIVLREVAGSALRVEIEPGAHWISRMQAGPFIFNVLSQFAIWTEDDAGNLVETLYVTGADFSRARHAKKRELQAEFFSQSLPVWSALTEANGSSLPSKTNPYPDSITSATPTGHATLVTSQTAAVEAMMIYLEINKSGDANETFSEADNDWAGQPSLVYAARLGAGSTRLELAGHGGRLGDEPAVYADLSGFDTALEQVASIVVTLE